MITTPQTAKLVKELRYRLGMTQEQFAAELQQFSIKPTTRKGSQGAAPSWV